MHAVAVRMVWRADFFSDILQTHSAIVSKGHEHLAHAHALIEQRLKGCDYAVGNAYSIVDPYLLVYFRWGNRMQLDMAGRYPAWNAHARRLEARPAFSARSPREDFTRGLDCVRRLNPTVQTGQSPTAGLSNLDSGASGCPSPPLRGTSPVRCATGRGKALPTQ